MVLGKASDNQFNHQSGLVWNFLPASDMAARIYPGTTARYRRPVGKFAFLEAKYHLSLIGDTVRNIEHRISAPSVHAEGTAYPYATGIFGTNICSVSIGVVSKSLYGN